MQDKAGREIEKGNYVVHIVNTKQYWGKVLAVFEDYIEVLEARPHEYCKRLINTYTTDCRIVLVPEIALPDSVKEYLI